ncbi:MAG: ribosomal protein L11 methyltransferase [Saprospiraceae bacterium]|nr:MAG: ribosomal protein L11 methyltransferase [Saprospiraceae bacterium]
MDYYQYRIQSGATDPAIIMAFLAALPFDSFEEEEDTLNAYIPTNLDNKEISSLLDELASEFKFSWERHLLPHQNWNEIWEANFQPIQVGGFCGIRADFHAAFADVRHEIIINPKMAFGTGHHATTYMMIDLMQDLNLSKKKILDYGCGTGILAILAAKLGAKPIIAVDIDQESYQNTIDNAKINGISGITTIHGTLEDVPGVGYEIILANINRNVILSTLKSLYNKLNSGGVLLISGILNHDGPLIVQEAEAENFRLLQQIQRDEWLGFWFEK